MQIKESSTRVAAFKLAAALERYEMDLGELARRRDARILRRLHEEFSELRLLGAALPKLSVAWVAVLVSRVRLLQALCGRAGPALAAIREHLAAVDSLHARCLRNISVQDGAAA